jgi:hypothetical protein
MRSARNGLPSGLLPSFPVAVMRHQPGLRRHPVAGDWCEL